MIPEPGRYERIDERFETIGHSDNREEWLELRRLGIGGSDAAGVLSVSPWSSAVSVFVDKVMGGDDADNEAMYWGRTLESIILSHYAKETGREVMGDGRLLRSLTHPCMQVTLDGVQCSPAGDGFVEVKNKRFPITEVPRHDWIQMQHQFAVTDWQWGSYAALCSGSSFYWCDVERDNDFIDGTLIPAVLDFWERVQAGGPTPSADASDATLEALKRFYPEPNGDTVPLAGELLEDDVQRQISAEIVSQSKDYIQGIDNRIKAAMGDATYGVLPNGRTYSWKARKDGVRVFRAPKSEEEQV